MRRRALFVLAGLLTACGSSPQAADRAAPTFHWAAVSCPAPGGDLHDVPCPGVASTTINEALGHVEVVSPTTLRLFYSGAPASYPAYTCHYLDHVDISETSDQVNITVVEGSRNPQDDGVNGLHFGCEDSGPDHNTDVSLQAPLGTRRIYDAGSHFPGFVTPSPAS